MATIHAGCVMIGECGLLIRGASGAGKSQLAGELIAEWSARGRFACLVADDRVALTVAHGRVIASPVSPLEGVIEQRGYGLVRRPFLPSAVIGLVLDLGIRSARLPPAAPSVEIAGILLPALTATDVAGAVAVLRLKLDAVAPIAL